MTMKFFSAGIAMAALLALAACKSENTGGAGGGIGGGSGGSIGSGGSTGGGGGSGGSIPGSCYDCACADTSPCKAVCDDPDPTKLNFCTQNMTNGSMCGQCVQNECGESLANCN